MVTTLFKYSPLIFGVISEKPLKTGESITIVFAGKSKTTSIKRVIEQRPAKGTWKTAPNWAKIETYE